MHQEQEMSCGIIDCPAQIAQTVVIFSDSQPLHCAARVVTGEHFHPFRYLLVSSRQLKT